MGDQHVHIILRDKVFLFMRQEIINVIPVMDVPERKPSFSDRVNDTPSRSPSFRELCMNLSDYTFTTTFMRLGLLKKELVLVFFFCEI